MVGHTMKKARSVAQAEGLDDDAVDVGVAPALVGGALELVGLGDIELAARPAPGEAGRGFALEVALNAASVSKVSKVSKVVEGSHSVSTALLLKQIADALRLEL